MLDRKLCRRLFVNRQPTLSRHSCPMVDIVPINDHENNTITLNPLFLEPLNADLSRSE
jgi:hypothetical protein